MTKRSQVRPRDLGKLKKITTNISFETFLLAWDSNPVKAVAVADAKCLRQ